jgi:prevent-host-death family protein
VHRETGNHKGCVAEAKIAAAAVELGITVLKPISEHGRYDLMFDFGARILRIQCKWASVQGNVIPIRISGSRHTPHGYVYSTYSADEIDVVAAYCGELDQVYFLPVELVAGRRTFQLRISPPKNKQRASIHFESEFRLGAVAQLGERLSGTQEAGGSSPPSSTSNEPSGDGFSSTVGAHEFRNHFGWYMERAAAGEQFLITRRGKPYVRLVPASQPA